MSLELLALGLETIGGLFGSSSQKSQQKAQMRQAQAQFDAQMDQTVQRRVADAKKAGVHPLFALGASAGASPTISASGEQRGDPMQSALTSMAKALGVIEQNRASAKRDEAEAALLDSERRRIEEELNYKGQDGGALTVFGNPRKLDALGNVINQPPDTQLNPDGSMTVPPEIYASKEPGVRAGPVDLWIETRDRDGRIVRSLNPELAWDELLHPGVFSYGWNRFWSGMADNLKYATYKLKQAGLTDQQITAQVRKLKSRALSEWKKRKPGTGEAGRRFHNRQRKM